MDTKSVTALIIFLLSYFLIAFEKVPRVYVAVAGVIALILFGVFTPEKAALYVDWETIGFIFGIFIIIRIVETSGFFNYLSLIIARKLNFSPVKIFIIFPLLAGLLAGFVSSITILVVLAPLTYALCKILKIDPVPLIVAEVCLANIGGASTLMGDPPNVILGAKFNLGFFQFLKNNGIIGAVSGFFAILTFYFLNRKNLKKAKSKISKDQLKKIIPEEAIEDKFLMKIGLTGLGSVVLLLVLRDFIKHLIPFNMALASLIPSFAILVIKGSCPKLKNLINEIDIETLIFFSCLFVIVGGLEETGIIKSVAEILNRFAYSGFKMMSALFWTGAMTSSIIDNVPEAIAIGYLIEHLIPSITYSFTLLVWGSSLGLDIGGNFTPIGASANVVGYSFLEKRGLKIGWGKWLKLAFLPTIISLLVCWIGLFIKYKIGFY